MYTKFYDNTLETKFIKQLVANTNVPFISVWKPGDFAIRGMMYITRDAIWRCNHTGWPESVDAVCKRSSEHRQYFVVSSTGMLELCTSVPDGRFSDPRYFTRVSPYVFGLEYFNVTGAYRSNILGYDETTHFYLGQYLRLMRDVFDLDLMPFYNCYAGEYTADIDFDEQCNITSTNSGLYKILSVPVKFGKLYMVALDSDQPVEMMCAVYGSKGILKKLTANLQDANKDVGEDHSTFRRFQKTSFKNPVIYKTISWHQLFNNYIVTQDGQLDYDSSIDADMYFTIADEKYDQGLGQFEKYLRLLIKVPRTLSSSVVVIEGDYRLCKDGNYLPKTFATQLERDNYFNTITPTYNTNTVTWTNKNGADVTVNSKLLGKENITESITKDISGSWVRPEIVVNSRRGLTDDNGVYIRDENSKVIEDATGLESPQLALFSPLGLLQVSDGNTYAFSNRLIEFLLLHAINHLDDFGKNIQRVQEYSKSLENQVKNHSRYTGAIVPGVWDEDFLKYIFELVRNTNYLKQKIDLTGYIDKDAETVITRGQRV